MKTLLITLCISIIAVSTFAAPTEEEAINDWKALAKAKETLNAKIGKVVPDYAPNIIETDNTKALSALNDVEKNDIPQIQKLLEKCRTEYGKTPELMNKTVNSVVKIDWNSGRHPRENFQDLYSILDKWISNIALAKKKKSEDLVNKAERVQDRMNSFATQQTQENFDQLQSLLENALKFDPDNKAAEKMQETSAEKFKAAKAAINKKIDDAKWPGHYKNFAGPGSANSLAKSAMEWLQNDEKSRKGCKDRTFAVAVKGDWVVAKKNILGEPIQWGLPIYAACYNPEEKKDGVCRVFSLTILTTEGRGVKKSPPWTAVWVGNIFKMKINNVDGAPGTGTGFFGGIFWLGLAFGNIIAGLLAAAPLLKSKAPQLKTAYEKITPFANIIGVIILAIGLLSLLGAILQLFILRFVIFSNIIPQLSAIAVGLFLGKEILMRKPKLENISKLSDADAVKKAEEAAENATAKAQELLRKYEDKINLLEKYQEKIGIACVVIGVLHLFLGCWPLI